MIEYIYQDGEYLVVDEFGNYVDSFNDLAAMLEEYPEITEK